MANNEKKEETITARQAEEKSKLLESFKTIPIIEISCKRNSIARATYYRWLENDSTFRQAAMEALEEGENFISDKSEAQLIALIGEKNLGAIKHWLDNHHPKYLKNRGKNEPEQKIRIIMLHDHED